MTGPDYTLVLGGQNGGHGNSFPLFVAYFEDSKFLAPEIPLITQIRK